nr:PAS domain S-box protein [bacterium]
MMKKQLSIIATTAGAAIASTVDDVAIETSFLGSWLFYCLLGAFIALVVLGVILWLRKRNGANATEKREQKFNEIARDLLEESELTSLLALIGPKICSTLNLLGLHLITFDNISLKAKRTLEENTALLTKQLRGELRVLFYFRDSRLRERMNVDANSVVAERRYGGSEGKQLSEEILTNGAELLASLEVQRYTNPARMPKLFAGLWKRTRLKIGELVLCPLRSKDTLHGYVMFISNRVGEDASVYKTLAGYLTQAVGSAKGNREQRVALENLDDLYTQQRKFNAVGTEILSHTDLTKICQQITSAIAEYSPFTRAILSMVEGKKLRRFAFSNIPHEDVLRLLDQTAITLDELEKIRSSATKIGRCFYHANALEILDTHGITHSSKQESDFQDWDPNSILFVPLIGSDDTLLGIISVDDPRDGKIPGEDTLQPLVSFTNLAAQAIATARLRQQLKRSQVEYRNLFFEATDALFVLDDEWHLITVNKKFISLTGYQEEDIVGKLLTEFTS